MLLMRWYCWCADAAETLMPWCCWYWWCTDAADALMLLMRWCCWCADAADVLMLLMRLSCWCTDALILLIHWCWWCTDAADVLMLLMHWCTNATESGSGLTRGPFYSKGQLKNHPVHPSEMDFQKQFLLFKSSKVGVFDAVGSLC